MRPNSRRSRAVSHLGRRAAAGRSVAGRSRRVVYFAAASHTLCLIGHALGLHEIRVVSPQGALAMATVVNMPVAPAGSVTGAGALQTPLE